MADRTVLLQPRPALTGVTGAPLPPGRGVTVAELAYETALITSAAASRAALRLAVRAAYGVDLPHGPKAVRAGSVTLIGVNPRSFLAVGGADAFLADELEDRLGSLASVTDQSGGQVVLRIGGPKVLEVFAKGFTIDLHPDVFRPGDAATTVCAHVGVTLWREDEADGRPAYNVALFRSFALAFWHWLVDSAGEVGLSLEERPVVALS